MRFIESLIFVSCIMSLLLPLSNQIKDSKFVIYLPDIALLFTILHLVFEGYRAPMLPVYLVTFIILILNYVKPNYILQKKWLYRTTNITLTIIFFLASLIPAYNPVPQLPKPSGKYPVGTISYKWTDLERKETLSADKNSQREIMVQFWYPAKPSPQNTKSLYMPELKTALSALNTSNSFLEKAKMSLYFYMFFDQFLSFRTNSYSSAPISDGEESYPVIIFSHGIAGMRNQNTYECEELASNGYIVISIDHPYEAYLTVFPDNKVIQSTAAGFITDNYANGVEAMDSETNHKYMDIRKADILFVLKELERQNNNNSRKILHGRTDLNKVGVMGFSCGGSLAADLLMTEKQFKAGISFDGLLFKDIYSQTEKIDKSFDKPFLFMVSDTYTANNPQFKQYKYIQTTIQEYHSRIDKMRSILKPGYKISITQTGHFNFCEYSIFMPKLRQNGLAGTIDPTRCIKIVASYNVAFFDKHLKNKPVKIFDAPPTEYPEVTYSK